MVVHRRHLPLAHRCEGFVPAPGSAGDGGFCERCQQPVHDVSAMRESDLRRLLAAHAGTTVCLAYRADARGRVLLRPEPAAVGQPLAVGALASLLAACAGHAGELARPGDGCRDQDGYAVSCPEWSDPQVLSVPDDLAVRRGEPSPGEGCPVRSHGSEAEAPPAPAAPTEAPEPTPDPIASASPDDVVASPAVDAAPGAQPSSVHFRANFSIDPDQAIMRGIVIASEASGRMAGGRLSFVPTKELWHAWRERRAERKQARERALWARRAPSR